MSDFNEIPAEDIEILDDEISFGTNAVADDAVVISDADTVLDVAAPAMVVGTAAPLAAAIVRETEKVEVVEETVDAPVAVISEPEPVYTAPIVEPVHHVRWPWALLALPLLAIPFLARSPEPVVAEPAVIKPVEVRTVEPTVEAVKPAPVVKAETPAPVVKAAIPTCDADFVTNGEAVLRKTAADDGEVVQAVAANTVVAVTDVVSDDAVVSPDDYYEVTVDTAKGFLPVSMVVCSPAAARTVVTG